MKRKRTRPRAAKAVRAFACVDPANPKINTHYIAQSRLAKAEGELKGWRASEKAVKDWANHEVKEARRERDEARAELTTLRQQAGQAAEDAFHAGYCRGWGRASNGGPIQWRAAFDHYKSTRKAAQASLTQSGATQE